jgi:hypothetical protein
MDMLNSITQEVNAEVQSQTTFKASSLTEIDVLSLNMPT